jgi:MSHA biogenesis protein MshJ
MTAKTSLKVFLKTFNRFQLRERQLVILTITAIIFAGMTMALWQPLYLQWVKSNADLHSAQEQIKASLTGIETIKSQSKLDANKPVKIKLSKLRENIEQQQVIIETITASLISPKNMSNVFSALLQNSELEVNKINNQAAEPIVLKGTKEADSLLYKHGLSLEMAGTFKRSTKYLERIENEEWNLYWNELTFTTVGYPQGILTLNVHTLSTSDHVFGL